MSRHHRVNTKRPRIRFPGASFFRKRPGYTLVVVALMLPVFFGMLGMVIDAGMMMTEHRRARNASDAAALAAAVDLLQGRSIAEARLTATTFVREHNRLSNSNVTINIPPSSGPHAGLSQYAEVLVTQPFETSFIQVLGLNRDRAVLGRSVAGYRPVNVGARVLTLNPGARPGLHVGGNGAIVVNGSVVINSTGGGVNENWEPVGTGSGTAASVSNNATLKATDIRVVGGVNNPNNFQHFDSGATGSPLKAGSASHPDPYSTLPPPTVATGADPTEWPAVHVSGNRHEILYPGVYPSIRVSSGRITFNPGIYIVRGGEFRVTNPGSVGSGVMFYLTGDDYNVFTGLPDANDLENPPPLPGKQNLSSATINAGLELTGLDDPDSPYHGMLFYQRRLNTESFRIQGNSSAGSLAGTLYAKWADIQIAGQGIYNAQFVVGEIKTVGNGNVHITDGGVPYARSEQVFLVE